ncbi:MULTISPECIES: HAD-IA family hydrolase [Chryseobacterium]|jgi:phosphonatase-like hydrolase|uniref:HAD family hydrolase n=1 Tax=Chryseobacterium rhizosphaerae TaxID=395937 RepID=A0ABX9IPJ1_9FLAO|nr:MULTISPECIES: HAD-IA family hydrolase [Chryseobacterium]MDR6546142.1 phosphonatase-like hydrolase [Chryseobacterium rhizosphaerae]REC77826.1 HAD family hydrolase [Chryseobacterium rhizosphaerae]GEN67114.1 phosphatase [Chryseobacterium rhizosphaerae]SMC91081.1 phosphonatase-like hydrolase [Chryseobacterium sp. YR221]
MKNIELLVLDMAGTTIDEDNVVYKTLTEAVNSHGYSVSLEKVLRSCAGMEKLEAITSLLKEINGNEEDATVIFENFSEKLKEAYRNLDVKPINGTENFLLTMKAQNKKVVLNTGYTSEIAHQLLDKLQWKENIHFDALITADDVSESRPSPEMINLAMKKFNIMEPEKVLKAGDSVIDIEEGKNAGCGLTIAVLSGAQNRTELEKAKPDYILNTISEAEHIL